MRWVSRVTTVAILVIVVAGFALWIRAKVPDRTIGQRFVTSASFRDGSRLVAGSPVVIAGVRIGDISRVTIVGRFARVDMRLRDDVQIPADSFITRRADSLFGDSYLEIIITAGDEGSQPARLLRSGEPITHVIEGASTDTVLRAMDRAMPKIESALDLVHEVMLEGRKVTNGAAVERLENADRYLASNAIEGPIESAHQAVTSLEEITARGAGAMAGAQGDVDRTLDRLESAVRSARTQIGDVKVGLVEGLRNTREGLDQVDDPIRQASEVMAAIHDGEGDDWKGTLGRLVNDEDLANTLEDVAIGGRDVVGFYGRFKSWMGARIEFNVFSRIPRFYVSAELRGRTDKFYLVELERGSLGGVPSDQLSDVAGTNDYVREQEIGDKLRFTVQFGKQMGPLSIRGGVKDSTFGAGADLLLMRGRLKLSADVFGSYQRTPRVKLAGAIAVFRSIYVLAGVDDVLNDPQYLRVTTGNSDEPWWFKELRSGRDYFIGAALHFDDADLATLLRVYGAVLASALAF